MIIVELLDFWQVSNYDLPVFLYLFFNEYLPEHMDYRGAKAL